MDKIKPLDIPQKMAAPVDDNAFCQECSHCGHGDETSPDICILHNLELEESNKICKDYHPDADHEPAGGRIAYNKTDVGNSEYFIDTNQNELRYCALWDKWLIWNDKVWKIDDSLEIIRRAKDSIRLMLGNANAYIKDDRERRETIRYALSCESQAKIMAMINLARSIVPVRSDDLDANDYLLCVRNGIVDLKTGRCHGHMREHYITKMCDVDFDEKAECPRFLEFLNLIFDNNQELIRFVQKGIGYSLTGDTGEQVMFILWGAGNNGKSTLLNTINKILVVDQYAQHTPSESLMQKKYEDDKRNDLASLQGVRFVTCSEGEEGRRLAESVIKDITGGDPIRCRFLRQEFFTYKPKFKIWYATNHKPIIVGTDTAIWRRIMLVEFKVNVPQRLKQLGRERISNYEDIMFKEEASGILNWAIEGCKLWQEEGLKPPECVLQANENYKSEMDTLQSFIDECCEVKPEYREEFSVLKQANTLWCQKNGEIPMSPKKFAMRLDEKGFDKIKGTHNVKMRIGIRVRSEFRQGDRLPIDTDTGALTSSNLLVKEMPQNASQSVTGHQSLIGHPDMDMNEKAEVIRKTIKTMGIYKVTGMDMALKASVIHQCYAENKIPKEYTNKMLESWKTIGEIQEVFHEKNVYIGLTS